MQTPTRLIRAYVLRSLFLGLALAAPLRADQVLYVNQNVPAGSNQSGTNWANAYRELRDAITAAAPTSNNAVEIWVARGTYKPDAVEGQEATYIQRYQSFVMKSHLRVLGGFNGTEIDPDTRNISANPTVLSGDIGLRQSVTTRVESASLYTYTIPFNASEPGYRDNSFNVVQVAGVHDVVLEGLIIACGNAGLGQNSLVGLDTNLTSAYINDMRYPIDAKSSNKTGIKQGDPAVPLDRRVAGAAIYVTNGYTRAMDQVTLILNSCTFVNNGAVGYGGAVASREAHVLASGCAFINNYAGRDGGAYWGMNQEAHLLDCHFEENESRSSGGALVLQSIPSEKIYEPYTGVTALELAGLTKTNIMTTVGIAYSTLTFAFDLANSSTIFHSIYTFFTTTSTTPLSFNSSTAASGVMAAYAALSLIVTITDLSTKGQDDSNNADLKRWRIFSEGFNTYATPGGWAFLLIDVISKQFPPTVREQA
ncbi:MAG TPA: hypothetical protein VIH35_04295, partial [Kiritimatiellia bacterium]